MALRLEGLCPLVQVFDMPTSIAFYRDVLGFEIVAQAPPEGDACDWAWLRHGTAELMLNTRYESHDRPPVPDPARVAAHDDTGIFIGCPDVDGAFRYLREKGLDVKEPVVQGYGMKQLYLKDPDGYSLCFQWKAL
jgi:glyoxylase I family protein